MSSIDSNELIASLAGGLAPVRPLRPPLWRAALWLLLAALLAAWPVAHFADLPRFLARTAAPRQAVELAATLLTAIAALLSAFVLSIPGYSRRWALLPLAPLLAWLAASGLGCLRNGPGLGPPGARLGESGGCYTFIVAVSVPLAALLFAALRRARPIAPLPVALCGALAVAAFAAFILQFFHPFDVTVIDLALHLAALATIAAFAGALRRALLGAG
ncbi:MAG: NrsF family protein [Steroidobacteraceae bacterium]